MPNKKITTIKPRKTLEFLNLKEIWEYRELFWTFVMRDIKVRYKQTFIGGLWAIIRPFLTMIVFSIFFGKVANISSEGVPYPIFSYAGLILWTYFTNAISTASSSLINSRDLLTKVYFPRSIVPLSATLTGVIDYIISGAILIGLFTYYQIMPSIIILLVPFIVLLTWLLASGIGLWFSAINVKYRDVRYALPFFIQLGLFVTPVIYPVSIAPKFKNFLAFNPMTGIIEAHRAMILGNRPIDLQLLLISIAISLIFFVSGAIYFKSTERYFADII